MYITIQTRAYGSTFLLKFYSFIVLLFRFPKLSPPHKQNCPAVPSFYEKFIVMNRYIVKSILISVFCCEGEFACEHINSVLYRYKTCMDL